MKIIRFIKRTFRGRKRYEIWDTSALSNYFELFKKKLQSDEKVKLVIPEGVSHEISVGRRNNEHCKEIYKFIEGNIRNPRLIIELANDSTRGWTVDEQVIYVANRYCVNGYDATMVTCDRDQSLRARLHEINVIFMSAAKHKEVKSDTTKATENDESKTPVVVPMDTVVEQKETEQSNIKDEIKMPSRMVGKQCWLEFNKHASVYDARGKRKISRPEGTVVTYGDTIQYNNTYYIVRKISKNEVTATISKEQ